MSENLTETEIEIGAYGESEIIEFFDHPIWKHVHLTLLKQRDIMLDELLAGDIHIREAGVKGRKYRNDDNLRGAMLMIDFMLTIPIMVIEDAEAIKLAREQLEEEN